MSMAKFTNTRDYIQALIKERNDIKADLESLKRWYYEDTTKLQLQYNILLGKYNKLKGE